MSEKTERLLAICGELEEIGERKTAIEIFRKISNKIKFVKRKDWINHQICADFPTVDIRCFVFCCSPAKNCIFRGAVLKKLGLTIKDYIRMKEGFAKGIKK